MCVDYSATAPYPAKNSLLVDGLPGDELVSRPATLSACELEKLHTECVVRINKYRSGALKFSDGTDDSNVAAGLLPLEEATGTNECSSQQAFGDLFQNVQEEVSSFRAAVGALGPTTRRAPAPRRCRTRAWRHARRTVAYR